VYERAIINSTVASHSEANTTVDKQTDETGMTEWLSC